MPVRPLVFMWIAEFTDGTVVPQFDPKTGKENKADPDWLPSAPTPAEEQALPIKIAALALKGARKVDEKSIVGQLKKKGVQVKRFGWHNFSPKLAAMLQVHGHPVQSTYPPISVVLDVKEDEQLVAARRMQKKWGLAGGKIYLDRGTGPTVYVLGIKDKAYIFVSEDGTIEMSSDYNYK